MKKKLPTLFLIVFTISVISTSNAQEAKIDSLTNLLENTSNVSNRVHLLLELSDMFIQTNPDTVVMISTRAFNLAEEILDIELMLKSAQQKGRGYLRSGSYEQSINTFQNMLDILESNTNSDLLIYKAHALKGIGNIFFIQFQQELALQYYDDALEYYIQFQDSISLGKLYDNIASAHLELKNFETAEEYYLKSLKIGEDLGDLEGVASTHINLAIFNDQTSKKERAAYHANKALEFARTNNALIMESYAVRILGSVAYQNENLDLALEYNERSLEIASEMEIIYELKDTYKNLAEIYYVKGDFQKAYDNYAEHKEYNDTLLNQESQIKLSELRAAYEEEKLEAEIVLLETENELKTARLIGISLSLSFVLVIVVIGGISFANRKKKEIELLEKNKIIAESKKKLAEEELENAQLREENLQKELTNYALHIVEKNDFLEEVKSEMSDLRAEIKNQDAVKQINKLGSKIYHNLMLNKDREEFEIQVEQACEGFFKSLEQRFPSLTNQERRLAALLRLNLSSKEISSILNISPKSVDQSRYRLRKKLDLPKTDNLGVFLNQI
jgi:hypothetical protein